jgi:hypothetical protein
MKITVSEYDSKIRAMVKSQLSNLNKIVSPYFLKKYNSMNTLNLTISEELSKSFLLLFEKLNAEESTRRGSNELQWIINYPWLNNQKQDEGYPFSTYAKDFHKLFIHQDMGKQSILLIIQIRDGIMKIPYYFCPFPYLSDLTKYILHFASQYRINELIILDQALNESLSKELKIYPYRSSFHQNIYASTAMPDIDYNFQDGSGDFIFT